jgi:hypothetical protein
VTPLSLVAAEVVRVVARKRMKAIFIEREMVA